jgi:hypothetical protein
MSAQTNPLIRLKWAALDGRGIRLTTEDVQEIYPAIKDVCTKAEEGVSEARHLGKILAAGDFTVGDDNND